eukprot:6187460-Pleurochrysis_carterae.AAC.2
MDCLAFMTEDLAGTVELPVGTSVIASTQDVGACLQLGVHVGRRPAEGVAQQRACVASRRAPAEA